MLELIDAQYTRRPFYGSRRMVVYLKEQGHVVDRKRVQRLMRVLGLVGMARGRTPARRVRSTIVWTAWKRRCASSELYCTGKGASIADHFGGPTGSANPLQLKKGV